MLSHEINLLKATMHLVTFSRLGSIPQQETIYPSNFPEGTPNVHFLGV
jgi:hypothetical protein